jgi:hypothetical protein
VSGRTRVRCPQPLQPRCPDRAGSRNPSVRRDRPHWRTGLDVSLWSVRGLVVAARIGPGGKGWSNVGRAWLARGSTPDLDYHLVCVPAAAPRSLLGDHGSWSSAGAGRLAGEQGKERVLQVPRRCGLGRLPAYWPTMGLDREVVTTLRGRCAGVGPLSSRARGPIRLSGEQPAAAARPQRMRSAVR